MSDPIIYIDHSQVRDGKLSELKSAMHDLVRLVAANEPRIVAYNVYFTEDGTHMTVTHIHHDANSLEFHMKVAGPAFPKFADFITLESIDIFGRPSEWAIEQLRQKAQMLGSATVVVHEHHAGLTRFAAAEPRHS